MAVSNKTLFTNTSGRPDLAHGQYLPIPMLGLLTPGRELKREKYSLEHTLITKNHDAENVRLHMRHAVLTGVWIIMAR